MLGSKLALDVIQAPREELDAWLVSAGAALGRRLPRQKCFVIIAAPQDVLA